MWWHVSCAAYTGEECFSCSKCCGSTDAPAPRLRADLEILPAIAEAGLCCAAKDISMGGLVGTAMMLAESSQVGAVIDIDAVPSPPGIGQPRWLCDTFPSFGFLLAVARPACLVQRLVPPRRILSCLWKCGMWILNIANN